MRLACRSPLLCALAGALLVTLPGCDNGPVGRGGLPLTGVLRDTDGRPIAGAGILVEYGLTDTPAARLRPRTMISFELGEYGHVRLWLTKPGSSQIVCVILDGEIPAGRHVWTWDGADDAGIVQLPGVYEFHLHTDQGETSATFFWCDVEHDDLATLNTLAGRRWHAYTRADGSFSIPMHELDCGFVLESASEDGSPLMVSVDWRVRVWAVSPGRGVAYPATVTIDPPMGAHVDLTLVPITRLSDGPKQ